MEKETKVGVLITVPINKEELPEVKSSNFTAVYHPDFGGSDRVFWAQRMTGKAILFTFLNRTEIAMAEYSDLKKILFKENLTGAQYPVVVTQWQTIVASNRLDTDDVVTVQIVGNRAKVLATRRASREEVLMRLARGFPNTNVVEKTLESLGWKIEPISMLTQVA